MKILHISPRFAPDIGGVETHVGRLAEELKKLGHSVSVVAAESELPTGNQELQTVRIPHSVFELTGWSHKWAIWKWWWQHRSLLSSADVVHVHDVGWWIAPIMIWLRKPWYITFHGWETHWPIRWQAKLHRKLMSKLARRRIHIGAWVHEMYGDAPDLVLYGAADLPQASVAVSNFKTKKPLQVVFVGRLEADNEIARYCAFLAALKESGVSLQMTWVGDGSLRPAAQKIGKVIGFVTDPRVYLAKADIVLANSYLSILSAQAHQKPVIACYSNFLKKRYLETLPTAGSMMLFSKVADGVQTFQEYTRAAEKLSQKIQAAQAWTQMNTWEIVAKAYLKLWGINARN